MADADRQRWDRRYAEPKAHTRQGPHPLLSEYAAQPGGRALELACGLGRDALWLAARGWQVDAVDISLTALHHARAEMLRRRISGVNFIAADLDHFPLPRYAYDLVYVFRFLDRSLFPALRDRVRPGGLVIYQTFNTRQLNLRPAFCPDHMLQLGELPGYFPGWTVLKAADDDEKSTFVGLKPADRSG